MQSRFASFALPMLILFGVGLVVNVAVAWACTNQYPLSVQMSGRKSTEPWPLPFHQSSQPLNLQRWTSRGLDVQRLGTVVPGHSVDRRDEVQVAERLVSGWPCRALIGGYTYILPYDEEAERRVEEEAAKEQASRLRSGVRDLHIVTRMRPPTGPVESRPIDSIAYDPLKDEKYLPLRPVLPGFAVNSLLYASILWLLFLMPAAILRAMIRKRRRERYVCEACEYPIGLSPVCTECGAPLTASSVAS